jgi:hypothetical protein
MSDSYNPNEAKYGFEAEDDLMSLNEEAHRNCETADALIFNDFKEWLTPNENFNEDKLFEFAKFKLPNPDFSIVWRTLSGWLEFGCVSRTENGFKILV